MDLIVSGLAALAGIVLGWWAGARLERDRADTLERAFNDLRERTDEQVQYLQDDASAAREELALTTARLDEYQKGIQGQRGDAQNLQKQIAQLKNDLDQEKQRSAAAEKLSAQHQQQISTLSTRAAEAERRTAELSAAEEELAARDERILHLEKQLLAKTDDDSELARLQQEIDSLTVARAGQDTKLKDLERRLALADSRELETARKGDAELESLLEQLQQQEQQALHAAKQAEQAIAALNKEIAETRARSKHQGDELTELREQTSGLEARLAELAGNETQLGEIRRLAHDRAEAASTLEHRIAELEAEVAQHQQRLQGSASQAKTSAGALAQAEARAKQHAQRVRELEEQLEVVENERNAERERGDELVDEQARRIEELELLAADLEVRLGRAEEELHDRESGDLDRVESLQAKIGDLEEQLGSLQNEHRSAREAESKHLAEIEAKEVQIAEFRRRMFELMRPPEDDAAASPDPEVDSAPLATDEPPTRVTANASPPPTGRSKAKGKRAPTGAKQSAVEDKQLELVLEDTTPDDLKLVKGIGPALEKRLNERGITTYLQIAELDEAGFEELAKEFAPFRNRAKQTEIIASARKAHRDKYS